MRPGAPPVRGKGACSHPSLVRKKYEPSFQPCSQRNLGSYGKKVSMPGKLTSKTTLDNLKKEAKRWLAALRGNDAAARERLLCAYPHSSDEPVL